MYEDQSTELSNSLLYKSCKYPVSSNKIFPLIVVTLGYCKFPHLHLHLCKKDDK